jgi:hypothetical protein
MNPSAGERDNSMAIDHLQNSGLTRAVTDLLADLAELLQKELRLAKTEITEKIIFRAGSVAARVSQTVRNAVPDRDDRDTILLATAAVAVATAVGISCQRRDYRGG